MVSTPSLAFLEGRGEGKRLLVAGRLEGVVLALLRAADRLLRDLARRRLALDESLVEGADPKIKIAHHCTTLGSFTCPSRTLPAFLSASSRSIVEPGSSFRR